MTAREEAKQRAAAIEHLADQIQQARDPYEMDRLATAMEQETRLLSEAMDRLDAEREDRNRRSA